MLNVNDLVMGVTKVKVLSLPRFVSQKVGDVGTFVKWDIGVSLNIGVDFGDLQKDFGKDGLYWFNSGDLEIVKDEDITNGSVSKENVPDASPDLIIYKSRWADIIENFNKTRSFITNEEVEIVKSVLKSNTPFNVVPDLKVIDPVIEKDLQTHLDANFVGTYLNACFYYRSETLKQWFYWNEDSEWEECEFDYNDVGDMLPVSFGESK